MGLSEWRKHSAARAPSGLTALVGAMDRIERLRIGGTHTESSEPIKPSGAPTCRAALARRTERISPRVPAPPVAPGELREFSESREPREAKGSLAG